MLLGGCSRGCTRPETADYGVWRKGAAAARRSAEGLADKRAGCETQLLGAWLTGWITNAWAAEGACGGGELGGDAQVPIVHAAQASYSGQSIGGDGGR
jgi:hypothetical protein